MEPIVIKGGRPLIGELTVQGSKNASLPVLAAALLIEGTSTFYNCPDIADVKAMLALLEQFGCQVKREGQIVSIDAKNAVFCEPGEKLVRSMRASSLFLGVSLARFGEASLPSPGGCVIGKRPLDGHVLAIGQMGGEVEADETGIYACCKELTGGEVTPIMQSVGVTEQFLLMAVCARGTTIIRNPAKEPEIVSLCEFLSEAGADIHIEKDRIIINGVSKLQETSFGIPGDRIVAASYLCMGLSTGCDMILEGIKPMQLQAVLQLARQVGGDVQIRANGLHIMSEGCLKAVPFLETAVYPGFPTDLQSVACAMLISAKGKSVVCERIFENRLQAAKELVKFGADLFIDDTQRFVAITGVAKLHGACVEATELRGGVALILAGLKAEGITKVSGCEFILRGHESIVEDLKSLGADICWANEP